MAIPTYETCMLPLLKLLEDGKIHFMNEVIESLARYFKLTPEEREILLPSGRQKLFENRVGWARTYLKKAGLIISPQRGTIQITERGQEVLKNNPEKIDDKYLMQFEEFKNFRELSKKNQKSTENKPLNPSIQEKTPDEVLEEAYESLRYSLAENILDRLKTISASLFEKIVMDVLLSMGYGGGRNNAGVVTGKPGDEGIDGIINQDPLGLDVVYIQAKKWENPVSRPEVQKFVGALQGKSAHKGIMITTSRFTEEARDYVKNLGVKVILIDGMKLAELMIDHNVGVSTTRSYEIKQIDGDYFEYES